MISNYTFDLGDYTTSSTTSSTWITLRHNDIAPEERAEMEHKIGLRKFLGELVGGDPEAGNIVRALITPGKHILVSDYTYQAVRDDEDEGWIVEKRHMGTEGNPVVSTWDYSDQEIEG